MTNAEIYRNAAEIVFGASDTLDRYACFAIATAQGVMVYDVSFGSVGRNPLVRRFRGSALRPGESQEYDVEWYEPTERPECPTIALLLMAEMVTTGDA